MYVDIGTGTKNRVGFPAPSAVYRRWSQRGGFTLDASATFDAISTHERDMLVRYCARFTGDAFVAEDLAQQTLLEAWRKSETLYSQQVRDCWLLGMARNVCLRWARERGASVALLVRLAEPAGDMDRQLADDFDLEVELERDDLARLLDRALALLPPETREAFVQKYVDACPQADVAARLALTEGAVEARLQRGKLALQRILTTDLRDEAVSHGLIAPDDAGWLADILGVAPLFASGGIFIIGVAALAWCNRHVRTARI